MSRAEKNDKKLAVLEVVKNKKDILFASSQNNAVTKKQKEKAWDEVLVKAKSLGMSSANRKWTYARDNIFGLWKSRMLAKRDNCKKTGTGGGRAVVLDVVDEAILDIIGTDSQTVEGLNLSRAEKNDKKLAVLEVVKNKKDILFASSQNNAVTKKQKEKAWDEVLVKAKSLGMSSANRKWTYARDNIFGLWKSRMLAKRENCKKTGTGDGRAVVLDVVDEAILDIIGTDSPTVEGLNLPEAGGDGVTMFPLEPNPKATQHCSSRKRRSQAEDDEITGLKKQLLKVEIYKNKLEALKLERELGIPLSEMTKDLEQPNDDKEASSSSL